jgi:y4mF family transcriptional regulator
VRDLGLIVRARRNQLGWPQEQLADAAQVSRWWISTFESGKAHAELDLVLRVVGALGLELDVSTNGTKPVDGAPALPAIDLDELLAHHDDDEAEP